MIFFGEGSLRRALTEFQNHYQAERPHQGKRNLVLFRDTASRLRDGPIRCRERLGGVLKWYYREAG